MILPTHHAFPIYGVFSGFTQQFVPSTMQFNSIDIVDNEDLLMAIDWINNKTDSNSIIYGGLYFKGWMNTLLKDQRIFEYHNMDFSNNGIYIVLEVAEEVVDEIDSINSPVKLLFSQGVFKIIEK
jgi:hypothetical protein